MCIIFYNEHGVEYEERELRNAYDTNSDGVGIMWLEKGKVNVFHGMINADELVKILTEAFVGVPHALHLRFATNGPTVEELCHPFKVSHNDAEKSVWMMHNGVLWQHGQRAAYNESDTQVFARDCAKDAAKAGTTDIFFQENYANYMEEQIGGDKMVFLRDDGNVAILNPGNWHVKEETGIWYSNLYSVQDRYRAKYTSSYASSTTSRKSAAASAEAFLEGLEEAHDATCICNECIEYVQEVTPSAPDDDESDEETVFLRWDGDAFCLCAEGDADIEVPVSEYLELEETDLTSDPFADGEVGLV